MTQTLVTGLSSLKKAEKASHTFKLLNIGERKRLLTKYLLAYHDLENGNKAIVIAWFSDFREAAKCTKFVVENHNAVDIDKWMAVKLLIGLRGKMHSFIQGHIEEARIKDLLAQQQKDNQRQALEEQALELEMQEQARREKERKALELEQQEQARREEEFKALEFKAQEQARREEEFKALEFKAQEQ